MRLGRCWWHLPGTCSWCLRNRTSEEFTSFSESLVRRLLCSWYRSWSNNRSTFRLMGQFLSLFWEPRLLQGPGWLESRTEWLTLVPWCTSMPYREWYRKCFWVGHQRGLKWYPASQPKWDWGSLVKRCWGWWACRRCPLIFHILFRWLHQLPFWLRWNS